jgi:hypothetical protein
LGPVHSRTRHRSTGLDNRQFGSTIAPVVGPSNTDVVVALTGASAALAGLVLVFLGVLVATYQQLLGPNTSDQALAKFKYAAFLSLALFGPSLAGVVVDVSWLIARGGHCFYLVATVIFFAQLVALAATAGYATIGVLLKG